jgi:hypothetical protein
MVLLASDFDRSRFLKAADIDGEKRFRIKGVAPEEVGTDGDKKLVVRFTNDERGLVLNKTNNRTLRGAFGDAVEGWVGRIIVVFSTVADLRGKLVPALRVRIPPPKQAAGNGDASAPPAKLPVDDELEDIQLLEPKAAPKQQGIEDDDLDDGTF